MKTIAAAALACLLAACLVQGAPPQGGVPYRASMEADPGLKTHMVYRRNDFAALAADKLPVVAS